MSKLFKAILENNLPEVRRLISEVDVNAEFLCPYHTGNHVICLEEVKEGHRLPLDQEVTSGLTPLHEAVRLNRFEIAEFLLQNGANPNKAVEVHVIIRSSRHPIVKNHLMWQNITPLHFCMDVRMADLLLKGPLSEDAFMAILKTPVYRHTKMYSPFEGNDLKTCSRETIALLKDLQTYLGFRLDPSIMARRKDEMLVPAAELNLVELTQALLENYSFSPEILTKALAHAIACKSPDAVRLCLEKGVNPNFSTRTYPRRQPIQRGWTLQSPEYIIVRLLAQYGAYAFGSEEMDDLFESMVIDTFETIFDINEENGETINEYLSLLMKLLDPTTDNAFFIQYHRPELLKIRQIYMEDSRSRWVIAAGEEYNDNFHPPTPIKEPSVFLTIQSTMDRVYPRSVHDSYKLAMMKIIYSAIDRFTLRLGGEDANEITKRLAIIEDRSIKVMTESFATNPHITFTAAATPVNNPVELSEAEVINNR